MIGVERFETRVADWVTNAPQCFVSAEASWFLLAPSFPFPPMCCQSLTVGVLYLSKCALDIACPVPGMALRVKSRHEH